MSIAQAAAWVKLKILECHRPSVGFHGYFTSVFLHFVVFDEQVGDVLCGGQVRLLFDLADALVQVQRQLRTLW